MLQKNLFGNFLFTNYLSFITYLAETPYIIFTMGKSVPTAEKALLFAYIFAALFWIVAAEFHYKVCYQ